MNINLVQELKEKDLYDVWIIAQVGKKRLIKMKKLYQMNLLNTQERLKGYGKQFNISTLSILFFGLVKVLNNQYEVLFNDYVKLKEDVFRSVNLISYLATNSLSLTTNAKFKDITLPTIESHILPFQEMPLPPLKMERGRHDWSLLPEAIQISELEIPREEIEPSFIETGRYYDVEEQELNFTFDQAGNLIELPTEPILSPFPLTSPLFEPQPYPAPSVPSVPPLSPIGEVVEPSHVRVIKLKFDEEIELSKERVSKRELPTPILLDTKKYKKEANEYMFEFALATNIEYFNQMFDQSIKQVQSPEKGLEVSPVRSVILEEYGMEMPEYFDISPEALREADISRLDISRLDISRLPWNLDITERTEQLGLPARPTLTTETIISRLPSPPEVPVIREDTLKIPVDKVDLLTFKEKLQGLPTFTSPTGEQYYSVIPSQIELTNEQANYLYFILENVRDNQTSFKELFPTQYTDRITSARAFYLLLDVKSMAIVDVEQPSPYEDITIISNLI